MDDDEDVVADCDFFAWNEVETATFALADNWVENIIGDIRMSELNGIKRYLYIRERGKEWRLRITN